MTKPWKTMAGLMRHWDPDQEKALCQEGYFDQTNQRSYTQKEQLIETWQERLLQRWDAPWKKWRRMEDTSAEAANTWSNRNRRLGGRQKEVEGGDPSYSEFGREYEGTRHDQSFGARSIFCSSILSSRSSEARKRLP